MPHISDFGLHPLTTSVIIDLEVYYNDHFVFLSIEVKMSKDV